jgi:tetratricopeptide (TPR) repeat protein
MMKSIYKVSVIVLLSVFPFGCASVPLRAPRMEVYSPLPDEAGGLWKEGRNLLNQGSYSAALVCILKALKANPEYGKSEEFMKNLKEAITKSEACESCLRR